MMTKETNWVSSAERRGAYEHGGRTHRTCPLSDCEPRSTWMKSATYYIALPTCSSAHILSFFTHTLPRFFPKVFGF